MLTKFGVPELLIILVIVLLLFGPGRLGKIAGELGTGIRNFRNGLSEGKEDEEEVENDSSEEKE
ncbi:MAG: twin-arginine translocase TatA/TatE family subunit [Anaerolineae bacterium]|jgi:sec-independent protein translocase protein TatA|nr:twin-arginine translocase TatA/TatE family subunit [Anaerolineae bacterium]MBT7073124.1 twin-arginine translocase TatA/TatE family subunit [Anaerolineae bacterium]MBT7326650.1 twin-arginine translocase TatA/TatE family subunit [Anaerolineae bacterium]